MKKYLFLILFFPLCVLQNAQAQSCDEMLKAAKAEEAKGEYFRAYQKYEAALNNCGEGRKDEIKKLKDNAILSLQNLKNEAIRQKESAIKAEKKAIEAQKATQTALTETEKAKAVIQAQLDQIRKKDQLQLSTYADNVAEALARYDISEARREMEKIRQTQIAPKDLLTCLEKQIADTVQTLMPDMVKVEGGTFMMGCDTLVDKCGDDETQHQVTLSTYQISKYEVTQALWQKVMGNNPSHFKLPSYPSCLTCPVENVSWNEVQDFIEKLNEKTSKKYRLPTEEEWEYAARGGKKSQKYLYAGTTNNPNDYAWYYDNSGNKTHPVGEKKPNELDLYDMSGNVREWCSDLYSNYSTVSQTNPTDAKTGGQRVFRGGGWESSLPNLPIKYRFNSSPKEKLRYIGFRLVL